MAILAKPVVTHYDQVAALPGARVADIVSYGAVPNSSGAASANTTAIQAAITAAAATDRGGAVYIPAGLWYVGGTLVIPDGVTIYGDGGMLRDRGSRLRYTGTGARFLDCRGGDGILIRDLVVSYSSDSFAGILVDFSGSTSDVTSLCALVRCAITSYPYNRVASAVALVALNGCQTMRVDSCNLTGAQNLVRGVEGVGTNDFSSGVVFTCCNFNKYSGAAVLNPGNAWSFQGCVFEPNNSVEGKAIYCECAFTPWGTSIVGCWLGDLSSTTTEQTHAWFHIRGGGWLIAGSYIQPSDGAVVRCLAKVEGLIIVGCYLDQNPYYDTEGIVNVDTDANANTSTGIVILGNRKHSLGDTFTAGTLPASGLWTIGTTADVPVDYDGGTRTLSFTNGLYTGYTDA